MNKLPPLAMTMRRRPTSAASAVSASARKRAAASLMASSSSRRPPIAPPPIAPPPIAPLPVPPASGSTLVAIRARRPDSAASGGGASMAGSQVGGRASINSSRGAGSGSGLASTPARRPHLPLRRGSIDAAAAVAADKPALAAYVTTLPILGASSLASFSAARRVHANRTNLGYEGEGEGSGGGDAYADESGYASANNVNDTTFAFSRAGSDGVNGSFNGTGTSSRSRPGSASSRRSLAVSTMSTSHLARTYGARGPAAVSAPPPRSAAPPSPPSNGYESDIHFISSLKYNISGLERELTKVKSDVHRALGAAMAKKGAADRQGSSMAHSVNKHAPTPGAHTTDTARSAQDPMEALQDRLAQLTARFQEVIYSPAGDPVQNTQRD